MVLELKISARTKRQFIDAMEAVVKEMKSGSIDGNACGNYGKSGKLSDAFIDYQFCVGMDVYNTNRIVRHRTIKKMFSK